MSGMNDRPGLDALREAALLAAEEVDNAWIDHGDHVEYSDDLSDRLDALRKAYGAFLDAERAASPSTEASGLNVERLAEVVSDSLAATTEGTDWAEAPEPSDEPGSPYVLRLTNEIASRLAAAKGPITDANGDELERGEPDYPGQYDPVKP